MADTPTASESFDLMLSWYKAHPSRGFAHLMAAALTGGAWATWFLFFWYGILVGWKDVDKLRATAAH